MTSSPDFLLYGQSFPSRLMLGTSQYPSPAILAEAARASGAAILTVSLRRESARLKEGQDFWRLVRDIGARVLPNTAGCYSVKEAVTTAHMAREVFGTPWIKLEVIGEADTLQPDVFGLVEAARILSAESFEVFPYTTEDLVAAERLIELIGYPGRVFFANSGAESNECALKLARKHRPGGAVIASEGGFHGRTLGSLSITGSPAKRRPFEPLPGPVHFVDFGDLDAIRAVADRTTAAVFVEPTLGEGGVVPAPEGFLSGVRAICDDVGALMVVDEVQSGIGRTGQWFACVSQGVRPDVITLAKGLGGGLPIGACVGLGDVGDLFAPGDHGSTFGGNPVACSAALAVLATIADEHLLDSVKRVGEHLAGGLASLSPNLVSGVRGSGLWRAVVLNGPKAAEVESAALARGLLVNAVKPDVIRLAPPLIVTEDDVDEALPLLRAALHEVGGAA